MPPRFSRRALLGATAGAAVLGPGALAACGDGSGGVSELTGSLITRWRADPYALGSYSYLAAGSTPGDRRAIAEPIGGRLFFAGEATSSGSPATTQGALLSGQRAAQEVLAAGGGRTIVVGAGLAGLGAARLLTDEGEDVLVVEARDRIGGRTWTDFSLSAPADMGASWIHGVRGNPITAIANEAGLELARTRYGNRIVYSSDGEPIPEGEIPRLRSLFSSDALIANPSDAIGRYLRPEVGGGGAEAELARFVASYEIEAEFAASIDELSIAAIDEGRALRGNDALILSGYSGVADAVAGGLDIRLETPVERIAGRRQTVTVSSGGFEESADRVVVTVPLGVLKAGTIEFEPKLPDLKQRAISRLGMGLLDKVYLQFDEVFWDPEPDLLGYLAPDGRSYAFWLNLFRYTGRPILVAFNAADVAEVVEKESDEEIVSRALGVLRAIYG